MTKAIWKPGTMLYPLPVVMLACQSPGEAPNIITVAWTGTVCTEPAMVSVSIRPERHSHAILAATGVFTINIPTVALVRATDFCGVVSGRDRDKFRETGLTPVPASAVAAPLIAECPLHLECRVTESRLLGSHTLFLAEIAAVQAEEGLLDHQGRFALERAGLVVYAHGHYYAMGKELGHFGFSVRKKKSAASTPTAPTAGPRTPRAPAPRRRKRAQS